MFSLSFKFDIGTFQVWPETFFKKDKANSSQNMTFLTIKGVNEDIKSKRKFCRQPCS